MANKTFSFEDMIESLRKAIGRFPDKREGKNSRYEIMDAGIGAFSVFFTQCPSFLEHQRMMQEGQGISNARTLFGIKDIPSDNHIRKLLDEVTSEYLYPVFTDCFNALYESGHLKKYRVAFGEDNFQLLLALDGTWYFSSSKLHCSNCSTKTHKSKTTYYHGMINPAVVAPGNNKVVALEPEFIVSQDGTDKQDCENKAAKRWLTKHGKRYSPHNITILGDDLYCHQPMVNELLKAGFSFILVCKPDSHSTLYEWLKGITEEKTVRKWTGKYTHIYYYRWAPQVPLKDGDDGLTVNWCELTIIREEDNKKLFKNAFATNHAITEDNVEAIVAAGRARWKTENENINTLKTKGYNLEHNYGHGEKHLSSLLATMNILAFLFHTMQEFMNRKYRLLRAKLSRRDTLFNDIRAIVKYWCMRNWDCLLQFMLDGLERRHKPEDLYKYAPG